MADELAVQVDDAQVRAVFEQLRRRTIRGGMRSVLVSLGRYGKTSTQLRFRAQIDPDGVRWKPSRRVEREGGQTLRKTSRLRNSIEWAVSDDGVAWGTNVEYATVHHFGYYKSRQRVKGHTRLITEAFGKKLRFGVYAKVSTFARRMKIPRRRFLGVNDADRSALLAIVAEDLNRATSSE
jgi:phage virion morphogenesis protein